MISYPELYNIETIANYIDNTSVATLLKQVNNYTKKQISILHKIPNPLPRKNDLLNLYDKALRLNDENALNILLEKYSIDKYFITGDDLPNVSEKELEQRIEQVMDFIQEINTKVDIRDVYKEKHRRIASKSKCLKYIKHDCTNNVMYLDTRLYLNDLPRHSLEWACHHSGIKNYLSMTNQEIIKAILDHKDKNGIVLKCIKNHCGGIYFKMYVIEMLENGDYSII